MGREDNITRGALNFVITKQVLTHEKSTASESPRFDRLASGGGLRKEEDKGKLRAQHL